MNKLLKIIKVIIVVLFLIGVAISVCSLCITCKLLNVVNDWIVGIFSSFLTGYVLYYISNNRNVECNNAKEISKTLKDIIKLLKRLKGLYNSKIVNIKEEIKVLKTDNKNIEKNYIKNIDEQLYNYIISEVSRGVFAKIRVKNDKSIKNTVDVVDVNNKLQYLQKQLVAYNKKYRDINNVPIKM